MTEKSPLSPGVAPDSIEQEPCRDTSLSGHIAREISGIGKTDYLLNESVLKHSEPSARRASHCETMLGGRPETLPTAASAQLYGSNVIDASKIRECCWPLIPRFNLIRIKDRPDWILKQTDA